MSGDSIDNMIENFVGSVRQKTEVKDKDQGSLGGFTLKEDKPKVTEYAKNESGAAKLLREKALLGWEKCFPKARKEPYWDAWGWFVKEHLGMSRISKKRLEAIFRAAGLGISDDHKMIIVIPEEKPKSPEQETKKEDDSLDIEAILEEESEEEEDGEPAPPNPMASVGPETFECGHTNWYTKEANEKAWAEGHCCAGRRNKGSIDWSVRGTMHPMPPALRRGAARFDNAPSYAWTGYCCCPHTGLYIGGTTNDCRTNLNGQRCVVHKDATPRTSMGSDVREEFKTQEKKDV